ncbi:MAG: S8 family serine peptidase [Luteolibacter sp.]
MAYVGAALCMATPLRADWKDEIGFTRLQLLAGSELPNAPLQGFTQVEALEISANYVPDTASPGFAGKTFTVKSGASGVSGHASLVASYFYGNTTSLSSGNIPVDLYSASHWLGGGFLKSGFSTAPAIETHAVQNHSWIAQTSSSAAETNQRLDFAIDRDGFVCVVGENNGNTTVLPELLGQGYHTISVGLVNGSHSAGFTTLDTTGRIKPDIVAPESYTSFATPMVSSAAGLLRSKLAAAPYSLSGADLPRVIKALLLASARKDTLAGSWVNTSVRPLDLRFGAGELNINHAYHDLRAGRCTASGSNMQKSRGWSAESVNGNSTKSYFFSIPTGTSPTPFCAAMTWHRIVTDTIQGNNWGNLNTSMADLDLHLYHASGFTQGTLISESVGSVDNVELVYQPALSPGDYVMEVENTSATATTFALAWHSLPSVGIVASNPSARELDLQQGTFTITRSVRRTPKFGPGAKL